VVDLVGLEKGPFIYVGTSRLPLFTKKRFGTGIPFPAYGGWYNSRMKLSRLTKQKVDKNLHFILI